ncbi:hypothetical protein [Paenibacillus caui]|uniref:hypothetical protein n=1 Tax=Paenibacillus caui TaxID=2873927 RepID=UPI001CA88C58|nr:hypothetical protein [Paenibacillus caui]
MARAKIEIDKARKVLHAELDGFPDPEAAPETLKNYNNIVAGIPPKEYSMLIDCAKMGVFQAESVPSLEKLFKLYMETGFKHIVFVKPQHAIANMQLNRIARNVPGFPGVFVPTAEEAWNICAE